MNFLIWQVIPHFGACVGIAYRPEPPTHAHDFEYAEYSAASIHADHFERMTWMCLLPIAPTTPSPLISIGECIEIEGTLPPIEENYPKPGSYLPSLPTRWHVCASTVLVIDAPYLENVHGFESSQYWHGN